MPDHLGISGPAPRFALLTGDPHRVPRLADLFGGGEQLTDRRGFVVTAARIGGAPAWIVSTGIGGPSTAIAVEELAELGVRCLIRVGSCGAIQHDIRPGDVVVATAAVRDEGTTRQYIDPSFPAVADHRVTASLVAAAARAGHPVRAGVVHSKDAYYSEKPSRLVDPGEGRRRWDGLRAAGVLATEMECAALFVLGALRRLLVGGILITVGKDHDAESFTRALGRAAEIIGLAIGELSMDITTGEPPTFPSYESFLDRGTQTGG